MARTHTHTFLNEKYGGSKGGEISGKEFPVHINRPGLLSVSAKVIIKYKNPLYKPGEPGSTGKPIVIMETPLDWKLTDYLGVRFTGNTVSMQDLDRHRDLRGFIKPWILTIPKFNVPNMAIIGFEVQALIKGNETIPLSSAAPLVNTETIIKPKKEFQFDLYRLGKLNVRVTKKVSIPFMPDAELPSTAEVSLIRPDGTTHTKGRKDGLLLTSITLQDLKQSRDSNGKIRNWKLSVAGTVADKHKIFAQVYDTVKLPKQLLLDRLEYLIGKKGENFQLKANWGKSVKSNDFTNRFTLNVNKEQLAENLDYYDLIDPSKTSKEYTKVETGIDYILTENKLGKGGFFDFNLKFRNLKLDSLDIAVEQSVQRKFTKIGIESPDIYVNTDFPYIHIDLGSASATPTIAIPTGLPKIRIELKTSNYLDLIH